MMTVHQRCGVRLKVRLTLHWKINYAAIVAYAAMQTNVSSLSRRLADSFTASMQKSAEIVWLSSSLLSPTVAAHTSDKGEQKKAAATKKKLPSTRWQSVQVEQLGSTSRRPRTSLSASTAARFTSPSAPPTARSAALSATQMVSSAEMAHRYFERVTLSKTAEDCGKKPRISRGFLFTSFSSFSYVSWPSYPWSCQSRSYFAPRLHRSLCLLRRYRQPRYRLFH